MLDGVRFLGHGRLTDRLWHQPAIAVLGVDAAPGGPARAKVGVRIAPGDDPAPAFEALRTHRRATGRHRHRRLGPLSFLLRNLART
jgi:cysteinylglycine-S-conjugate dipeptidase